MSSFPSILPAPEITFSGSKQPSVVRTAMDSGRYRQRRRFTRENRLYTVKWEMSDYQLGIFQGFVAYDISGGAEFFTIALPTGGEGLKTVNARIVNGEYAHAHKGLLYWDVTCTLEVEAGAILSQDDYTLYALTGDIDSLEAAAADIYAYSIS